MKMEIKKQLKTLNLLYILILGVLSVGALFVVIMVYKAGEIAIFNEEDVSLIKTIVIIALLVGIPVSHIFFFKKIKHINPNLSVIKKIELYKTAFLVRITVLESIGVLGLIGYWVSADKSFLYMFGVVFILFLVHAPTKSKLINDLNFTEEEENEIL